MEYYSATKNNKTMPFVASLMYSDYHTSEVSHKEKDTLYDITFMWNLKYYTEKLYETETDSDIENRLLVAKGEVLGEGWSQSLGSEDAS